MDFVAFSKRRLRSFLEEIDRLKESEFAYPHSRQALDEIEGIYRERLKSPEGLPPAVKQDGTPAGDPSVAKNACTEALTQLHIDSPLLGFLLRSTNVRNAFEVYPPLLRLAAQVLGPDTKLVLSSEWDYSPFVYAQIAELPGFVLIAFPAPESSNPLLLPLAGHELGHAAWAQGNYNDEYEGLIEKKIVKDILGHWSDYQEFNPRVARDALQNDMFARKTWILAHTCAMLQREQIFCDLLGLKLFGESYLYAFAYLVAPRTSGGRSFTYPNVKQRISHLEAGAGQFDVKMPEHYAEAFEDQQEPTESERERKFLLSLADTASSSMATDLIAKVKHLADEKSLPERSEAKVEDLCRDLERLVPARSACNLADVLNAGWQCSLNSNLWRKSNHIEQDRVPRILGDLILKSIEVLEFQQRVQRQP